MANALIDSVHKIVSPSTYDCNLCAITYGVISEDELWKGFRENSGHEMVFLHSDEFNHTYKSKWLANYDFPVILIEDRGELVVFLSSEEINQLNSAEDLIESIMKRQRHY